MTTSYTQLACEKDLARGARKELGKSEVVEGGMGLGVGASVHKLKLLRQSLNQNFTSSL